MEREGESEFNYSLEFLKIIRQLENICITARLRHKYLKWLNAIEAMNSELDRIMSSEEKEFSRRKINEAKLCMIYSMSDDERLNNVSKTKCLTDAECYLKTIIQEKGAGLKWKRDPGKSLFDDQGY